MTCCPLNRDPEASVARPQPVDVERTSRDALVRSGAAPSDADLLGARGSCDQTAPSVITFIWNFDSLERAACRFRFYALALARSVVEQSFSAHGVRPMSRKQPIL